MHLPEFIEPLGDGIYAIDTGFHRPRFDAAYLMVEGGRALFIDTGTNHAVPRLLQSLEALGLARDAVDWVIPTHVHLDHAGGAGLLMSELPHARLLVHARGAKHMIDPRALYAGALAVYGVQEMDRSYGQLLGIDAARVDTSFDGQTLAWAGRDLHLIDTPGHARHHHCIWDERSQGWFTGDTFGLAYPELRTERGDWVLPSSTPVAFDPPALRRSVARLMARQPRCMYLTHYSRVHDVPRLAQSFLALLDEVEALGRGTPPGPARHAELKAGLTDIYSASLARHGCTLSADALAQCLAMDIELNAQGMACWLDQA